MTKLMIIVGSVRPGRVGLPVAEWVRGEAERHGGYEIDFVDLAELGLPFMDEPKHPRLHEYAQQHTLAWSERVEAAEAFVFVTPEYNYSYSPALKNALDYLSREWWLKPVGFVSYGGASSGTRGAAALMPVLVSLGLYRVPSNLEMTGVGAQITDGVFQPSERESAMLRKQLQELAMLAEGFTPIRAAAG